jgi:PilZ domain
MPSHERRIAARKAYAIPVRFNVITEQYAMASVASATTAPVRASAKILTTIPLPQQGEIVNLSERGIAFKTKQNLSVGESVEIFFTLPTALTGRSPEDVRCNARVVRLDKGRDMNGMVAIGAAIDRFERTAVTRNWENERAAVSNCLLKLLGRPRSCGERHLRGGGVVEAIGNLHGECVRARREVR